MSDYTPTTEEVRTDYVVAYTNAESSQLLAGMAFDRWLAKHDAEQRDKALDGARKELQAAYKRGPGNNLQGRAETWRKGVSRAHRIVQDYQRGLRGGAS